MAEDGEKRGFSGLSSLTSKVEKQAAPPASEETERSEPDPQEKTTTLPQSQQSSQSQQKSQTPSPSEPSSTVLKSSGWRWIVGVAGVILVIVVYNSNQSSKRSLPSPSYAPSTSATTNSNNNPPATKPKPSEPPKELEFTFELPPIGKGQVLSLAQIRWCLRENIRMGAKEPLIDSNSDVAVFNQSVNNYNSRCASYKYRRGNLERAKRQVEELRPQIAIEAKREFKPIIPQQSSKSTNPRSEGSTKESLARETVREVQKLLKELGYKPGTIDGKYGKKTSNAIKAFQRDTRKLQNGLISEDILTDLRTARIKASENGDSRSRISPQKDVKIFSVEQSKFIVVLTDKQGNQKVIQSNRVPFDSKRSCYSWQLKLSGITGSVELREILQLPSKPQGGWPIITDGSRNITPSLDQKSATTERTLKIIDGWVSNMWCVADGDPLGLYSIDVFLNERFIKTFKFDVVRA